MLAISANLTLEGFFLISFKNSPRTTSHLPMSKGERRQLMQPEPEEPPPVVPFLLCSVGHTCQMDIFPRLGVDDLLAPQSRKHTSQEEDGEFRALLPPPVCWVWGMRTCRGAPAAARPSPPPLTFSESLCRCRPGSGRVHPGSPANNPAG